MKAKFFDDHFYHVYNRGVHKSQIFFSEQNYEYGLKLISKYSAQYKVSVVAYCLMPNHYHLLVWQQAGGSTARFLQTTFNAYTQAVNKQQNLHGTLFEGSAQSLNLDTDSYVLQLVRYIHLNPVAARLVTFPQEWKFSDYSVWAGFRKDPRFDDRIRKRYFADGGEYRFFVEEYLHDSSFSEIRQFLFEE